MAVENVKLEFGNQFKGFMEVKNGTINLSMDEFSPYNLLLGALGGCLYATFLGIVEKKKLSFSGVRIDIGGVKRETPPTTLEEVKIKFLIKEPSNEKQFIKSAELASKYCSIYETISKVAKMNMEVIFD